MLYKGNQKIIGQTYTIQEIKKAIYPVGSVIVSFVIRDFTIEMPDTTWELEEEGRMIEATQDTSKVNTKINAGLPNLTWYMDNTRLRALSSLSKSANLKATYVEQAIGCSGSMSNKVIKKLEYDASVNNTIYGKSNTVQPNTRKYYIYRRIA